MGGTVTIWDVSTGRTLATMLSLPPAVMKSKDCNSGYVQGPARPVVPPPADSMYPRSIPGLLPEINLYAAVARIPSPTREQISESEHREWIVFTPDGYYNGSPDAEAFMQWERENGRVPGAVYRKRFRQPAQVAKALSGH